MQDVDHAMQTALSRSRAARGTYEGLAPSHRHAFLSFLAEAPREDWPVRLRQMLDILEDPA